MIVRTWASLTTSLKLWQQRLRKCLSLVAIMAMTGLGGPAGEFPANIFESAKIWEKSLERKNKKTSGPQTDGRTNFVDNLLPPLLPPPLGQAITFPSQGNWYIFLTLRHNTRRGWCCSIGKISINFAPVAFMNAKTSHGPECGWLTRCQPRFYDCFFSPYTQSKQRHCTHGPQTAADGRWWYWRW